MPSARQRRDIHTATADRASNGLHAEALFRSWIYASTSDFGARQQVSARLATYHTPADGIGNGSLRRMLVQCKDDLARASLKLSYPDDALSLARDSEKEGKTTAHSNVAALAQLAEDARIDFRVLVLTRDLASAARSRMQPTRPPRRSSRRRRTTRLATRIATPRWRGAAELTSEARRWRAELRWPASGGLSRRPFESQARILADEECILAAQLRALDGAFWRTVPYESLVAQPRRQAAAIARFVRAPVDALAQSFERRVRASGRAPPTAEGAHSPPAAVELVRPEALARDAVYGWEISQESESEGRRLETSSAASTSRLPSYASLYPSRRTPAAQLLSAVEDAAGVLWRDVETVGLSRLAAARANPTTRDLVIVSTDRKHLDIAVNCVANLANVGIREYIVLADTAKTCEALRGRLACVWSTLLTPFSEKLKQGATGPAHLWLSRQIYAGQLAGSATTRWCSTPLGALCQPARARRGAPAGLRLRRARRPLGHVELAQLRHVLPARARRGDPLLAAWRNGAASSQSSTLRRRCGCRRRAAAGARLPAGEAAALGDTLLDWTFAGAVVGDPAFIGRGRTNDSRVLTRTEKAWMRWSPLKATEPPPARFSTPGSATPPSTRCARWCSARGRAPSCPRRSASARCRRLLGSSAESDKEVKGNGASTGTPIRRRRRSSTSCAAAPAPAAAISGGSPCGCSGGGWRPTLRGSSALPPARYWCRSR